MNEPVQVQVRVAGLLISEEAVLLESLADREVWGVPGGSLEPRERLHEGCRREFLEELGLEVRCDGLAVVMENRFQWEGEEKFELGFYFRVAPVTPFSSPCPPLRSLEPKLQFRWFPLAALTQLAFLPRSLPIQLVAALATKETVFFSSPG